jgi:predicted MFS family arabinose efflux permease
LVTGRDRWARVSASAGFVVQGLSFAAVIAQVSAIQQKFGFTDGELTMMLASVPILAGVGSVLAGILAPRLGSRWVLGTATIIEALCVAGVGLASQRPLYFVVLALLAIMVGAVDAAMNMQGTAVQRRYGRSILASCHGWWSVGAVVATSSAFWAGSQHISMTTHLGAVGALGFVLAALAVPGLLPKAVEAQEPAAEAAQHHATHGVKRRGLIVTLVGIALMVMFVGDSAATSYGTPFMNHVLGFDPNGAKVQTGLLAYLVFQLLGRVVADRIIGAAGAARTLVGGSLVAAAGFAVIVFGQEWATTVVGFGLMGAGLSVVVPLTFSAADGLDPAGTGTVIARVNLFNYLGVLLGAGSIGAIAGADYTNLRAAFAVPGVLVLLSMALAPAFRVVDRARAAAREASAALPEHQPVPAPATALQQSTVD